MSNRNYILHRVLAETITLTTFGFGAKKRKKRFSPVNMYCCRIVSNIELHFNGTYQRRTIFFINEQNEKMFKEQKILIFRGQFTAGNNSPKTTPGHKFIFVYIA